VLKPTEWPIGETYLGGGKTAFRVCAPAVAVHLISPKEQVLALEAAGRGYYQALIHGVTPGAR
jgi:hypothetical protein